MPFTVHPVGFLRIEPRTLDGQQPGEEPDSPSLLYLLVVRFHPGSDLFALVPTRIVPDHYQYSLSSFLSYREQIFHELQGVGAVGLAITETQMHLASLMIHGAVTGYSLVFGIILTLILLQKSQ